MASVRPAGGRQAAWMVSLSCTSCASLIRAMSLLQGETRRGDGGTPSCRDGRGTPCLPARPQRLPSPT